MDCDGEYRFCSFHSLKHNFDVKHNIRRGAAARTRIAPLELFSTAEPSPAKAAAAALGASVKDGATAAPEATGCQSVQGAQHTEQVTDSEFADGVLRN